MTARNKLFGLVLCGGNSSRMGQDKSMLVYYQKPQRYHLYELLSPFCDEVFISCNQQQAQTSEPGYQSITDHVSYRNTGPMASLLSAFEQYPQNDFLVIGCDYPYLSKKDLAEFFDSFTKIEKAAAFYNEDSCMYEPLLAYYDHSCAMELAKMHAKNEYSLQHFLKTIEALKFLPRNKQCMQSVDTPTAFIHAKKSIKVE